VLKRLSIRDFGIIDDLVWLPSPGLNVLTGETGAGKSLVLDALDVLAGRRAGQEVVRTGAAAACIEAEVAGERGSAAALPGTGGLAGNRLVIRREVERSGRGAATVDGRAAPVRALRELATQLFDLHGPNQQFALLDTREQLLLLDGFAGSAPTRAEFAALAERLREVRAQLQRVATDDRQAVQKRDMLMFEAGEIAAAELKAGEDEELEQESARLEHIEKLREAVSGACEDLYGGDGAIPSGSDRLGEGLRQVRDAAAIDRSLVPLAQAIESALCQVEDAARELGTYRDSLEYDAERHQQVQARLDLIHMLKKKYGGSIDAVLAHAEAARQELATLESSDEQRGRLTAMEASLGAGLAAAGERLSRLRREAAVELSHAVETELADLMMAGTGFTVSFAPVEGADLLLSDGGRCGFTSDGIDDIEFLIRPNLGEPFMPLARSASTGETSRLMLAIRCALSRGGGAGRLTLVFDEIDIGVGGRSGEVIGRKLAGLARSHQVICITHLPQVAAYGDSQFTVVKKVKGNRTSVEVKRAEGDAREAELSAMLGSLGEPSLFGARELLQRARSWKSGAAKGG